MKMQVGIKDANFDLSIRKPKNFSWVSTNNPVNEKTFVTDRFIPNFEGGIAWIVEPPAIDSSSYNWIKLNHNKYKFVLTYSEELLQMGGNFLYYPFGNTLLSEDQFEIYESSKNKLLSMVMSNKNWTEGHNFRHRIKNILSNKIDLLGSGVTGVYSPKINSCKEYYFQVVVENSKYEHYFTEKIVDCFLTGVIPIYWGSSKVLEHFDENGIITFNSENELIDIINNLNIDTYLQKFDSVKNNFENAKKYTYSEDWIFENYKFLF